MDVWRFEVLVVDTRIGTRKLRTLDFSCKFAQVGATVLFKEWVSSLFYWNTKLGLGREIFTTVGRILFYPFR